MDPQQIMSRMKALLASFNPAQLASLVGAFVLVVGVVIGSAWWVNAPTFVPLFSDMDPETAGDIVSRLKSLDVPYELDAGGRTVRVPANRADELRLELTAQGLPSSGRIGFELFDRTAFGATEFLEQVNYRRALEGEIARTIATISEVSSARVHIAMGKDSLFGEPRPAKASVVLKLRDSRRLNPATIHGITNLVAASVEGLDSNAVVVLDSFGRPLVRPSADDMELAVGAGVERQERLERELSARVVALLEPVIGPERVRVNVALKLNPSTVEQTEERWDPNTVVRSRQTTSDSSSTTNPGPGLAGARGNMPAAAPDPKTQAPQAETAAVAGTGASRSAETVNYEIGRTTVVTHQPPGEVARLSVAVIVDDDHVMKKGSDGSTQLAREPRSPEQLQKIQGLVAAAVGFEAERGDQIIVQNVSFEEAVHEAAPALTTLETVKKYSPEIWAAVRLLVVALIGLFAMLFFVKPLMQRVAAGPPALQPAAPPAALAAAGTQPAADPELDAPLDAASRRADAGRLPVLARQVSALSAKQPENAARLLRSWLNEGER